MSIPPNGRGHTQPPSPTPSPLTSRKTVKSGTHTVSEAEGITPIADGRRASTGSKVSESSSSPRTISSIENGTTPPSIRDTLSDNPGTKDTSSASGYEEDDDDSSLMPDDSVSQISSEPSTRQIRTVTSDSETGKTVDSDPSPGELDGIQGGNPEAIAAANSALTKFKDALPNGKSGAGLAMALTGGAFMAVPMTAPVGVALFIVGVLMYAMNADDDGSGVAPIRPGSDDDNHSTVSENSENSENDSLSGEFLAVDKHADIRSTPADLRDTSLERMEKARDKVKRARDMFISLGVNEVIVDEAINHLKSNGGAVSPDFFLKLFGALAKSFPEEGISEAELRKAAIANGCEELLPGNIGNVDPEDPRLAEYIKLGRTLSGN